MARPSNAARPGAALVTGAARRIGHAIAEALAGDGWAVAVHYAGSRGEADALVRAIRGRGGRAVALKADLARETEAQQLVPRAAAALGPIRCLVNNAAVFERDEALSATRASWDRHMEINLRAPFVLTQAFARQLPRRTTGHVVNLIDERVWNLTPHFTSYTLSKFGLWGLTRTLALALAPRIRVNAIGPGPTLPSSRQSAAQFRRQNRMMPLGRGTTPEEVAAAVRFILAAPAMTGQMIALDGGQHLAWTQPGEGPSLQE
ncbi:MAG: SDR family oxidoreductase [Alphaproteobacteria bacterium]|nr:SDR family oxidoreductase [Alphaproteobacteria bacterium]